MTGIPSIVILPRAPHAQTGTGQRSLLLIEGASKVGPVHVVLLAGNQNDCLPNRISGASSIHLMPSKKIAPSGRLSQRLIGALRVILPIYAYRTDQKLQNDIKNLIVQTGARNLLFRYIRTFCVTGLQKQQSLQILVDVDDRDDQKYRSRLVRIFGEKIVEKLLSPALLAPLSKHLRDRLAHASLVWFAAEEDTWPLEGPVVRTLPNIPFNDPGSEPLPLASTAQDVLFVGSFSHQPNVEGMRWFLDHCWAGLAARCPNSRLRVVGRGDWQSLASQYAQLPRLDLVGTVEDLAAEYSRARLCISPILEGGGSKIKVIEAAAFSRPVVATSHALRGFAGWGREKLVGTDDPKEMIDACAHFLKDGAAANAIGAILAKWQKDTYSREGFISHVAAASRSFSNLEI